MIMETFYRFWHSNALRLRQPRSNRGELAGVPGAADLSCFDFRNSNLFRVSSFEFRISASNRLWEDPRFSIRLQHFRHGRQQLRLLELLVNAALGPMPNQTQ